MVQAICEINEYIVHKLEKEVNTTGETTLNLRSSPLAVNDSAQRLIDAIHEKYSKLTGKSFGTFEANLDNYPTQKYLKEYLDGENSFHELSVKLMERLEFCAKNQSLAKGGYVLISKMSIEAEDYFLVAVVTDVLGTAITETYEVVDSMHIDLTQLRVVGRINLTEWLSGNAKYISFLKGNSDVSKYFKEFIGCNDVHAVSAESKKVVEVLKRFASSLEGKTDQERDTIIDNAFSYLKELSVSKRALSLDALANHVYPEDPETLKALLGSDEYKIIDGFIPDGRSINGLLRYEGKSKHWTLKFDRVAVRSHHLRYDQKNRIITLSEVSESLHNDLIEVIGEEEEDE